MISKDLFLKAINFIYSQRKKDDDLCNAIMEACTQSTLGFFYSGYEDILVKVLQESMNDINDIIGYKLYELDNLAASTKEEQIAEEPYLATWETVYNYLAAQNTKEEAYNIKIDEE